MAEPGVNALVAWLPAADSSDQIAGCAVLVAPDLALTCAHVVRDHLGPRTPEDPPGGRIRLVFPGRGESEANVARGGWWPDRKEPTPEELVDLAVLCLEEPRHDLPYLLPSPQSPEEGEGFRVFAYPASHRRVGRDIIGEVRSFPNAYGWHQLDAMAGRQSNEFIRKGFSGAPVFDKRGRSILGLVVAVDGDLIAHAIPAADLRRALGIVHRERFGTPAARRRERDEMAAAIVAEAELTAEPADLLADARSRAVELRQQVVNAGNRLPENFGARVVEPTLEALSILLGRKRLPPLDLGIHAAFLTDFALALDRMVSDDRPELKDLVPLAGDVLATLDVMDASLPSAAGDADQWPPGVQMELKQRLIEIEGDLPKSLEVEDRLKAARQHVLTLRGQAERDQPEWPVLRNEAVSLERCLQGDENGSPLGEVRQSASALATLLREAASLLIRELGPGRSFQELLYTPEMVMIPSGTFMMGSPRNEEGRDSDEGPQHEVQIAYRFAVGRHPVTFEEYDRFAEATNREPPGDQGWGRGRRSVINVSWDDAKAYVAWLSEETSQSYRLPSEAEWEYACRAGTTTRYSWGDQEPTPDQANFGQNVGKTTEVGAYPPNPWGLHDMHGNVWEWVEDCWNGSYEGAPSDGSAWTSGNCDGRVLRGGSWNGNPGGLRSAYRCGSGTGDRGDSGGFRVARTLSQSES